MNTADVFYLRFAEFTFIAPTLDEAEKKRFGERTVVERINSRLKDGFGCGSTWVKGHAKVLCHTSFAVLAVSVDALMRLMLCEGTPQVPSG